VAFAYADTAPILSGVDLHFSTGFTALVGANGAGKSTLLSLIKGDLKPDEGRVRVEPAGGLVVSCPQTVDDPSEPVVAFVRAEDRRSVRLRAQLALDEGQLARWVTLSHGERKRLQIGAALAAGPDVLLLDEPTNHLDASARELLVGALRRFDGVGIVVSHDRAFIEALAVRTAWLEDGSLRLFDGGYGTAEEVRRTERDAGVSERSRARAEERRSARALDERRRRREAAGRNIGAKRRMKGPRDSDGRSVNRKGRAAKAEAAHARGVKSMGARHARNVVASQAARVDKELGGRLFVDFEPPRARRLASLVLPELRIGERTLARGPISLVIERDSRVRISGDNGAGKSTLLAALVAALPSDRTLHLPQELDAEARRRTVERVRSLPKAERGRVLTIVAALGSDPKRILATALPSPGEAKKLRIAEGLGKGASCLILDEPTNHLDLPSIARLEDALAQYPGALVLVTHDAWFGERLTNEEWHLDAGEVSRCVGPDL